MKILRIDTSDSLVTKIEIDKNSQTYKIEEKRKSPTQQNVLEVIEKALKKARLDLKDINMIQVKTGPGSFTGLRVGVSIANTLSFALGISVNNKRAGETETPTY